MTANEDRTDDNTVDGVGLTPELALRDAHDELSIIEAAKGRTSKSEGMSREQQTAWIVGTLLVIAVITLGLYLGQDDPRYPGCIGFMGVEKSGCKAEIATRRLGGSIY